MGCGGATNGIGIRLGVRRIVNVTPLILTFNEAPNIARVLDRLSWARRIVIVDSGSTDGTLEIVQAHPAVEVVHRPFTDHTSQWNHGLDQVHSEWVLTLDADYVINDAFVAELKNLTADSALDGYAVSFSYCIHGRPLRGSLYPPRVALFRTKRGRYVADGHTQRLNLDGPIGRVRTPIAHDDRKSLSRWLEAQDRYAALEADKLRRLDSRSLSMNDRIRRFTALTPIIVFFYCLFVRGTILDGRSGVYYALQRMFAETLLALRLREPELSRDTA